MSLQKDCLSLVAVVMVFVVLVPAASTSGVRNCV
jgi:hypothetical protein